MDNNREHAARKTSLAWQQPEKVADHKHGGRKDEVRLQSNSSLLFQIAAEGVSTGKTATTNTPNASTIGASQRGAVKKAPARFLIFSGRLVICGHMYT